MQIPFQSSERASLGVEWELQLVDLETRELTAGAVEILEENFGDLVFKTRIRKTVRYAEAPVKGSSVLKYDPSGTAAEAYRELGDSERAAQSFEKAGQLAEAALLCGVPLRIAPAGGSASYVALAPDEWAAPPRRGALRWRTSMAAKQDDELAAEQYALAERALGVAGYEHYEISNLCQPKFQSRHNVKYWTGEPYYGFGCSSHSYDGRAHRWSNERDVRKYVEMVERGESPVVEEQELGQDDVRAEALFL